MFQIYVDFEEIRERLTDAIFAGAGQVASLAESVLDGIEQFVESVNDATE